MSEILPIFYCNSSTKSILTSWLPSECGAGGAKSIIGLCKEAKLDKALVVSNNFHNFIELSNNFKKENIQLIFGLEILMCADNQVKTEDSVKGNFKVIVILKNSEAYFDAIKLYTGFKADKNAKYYEYRCDFATLKKFWTPNLILLHPFFNSWLSVNNLRHNANIVPDFPEGSTQIYLQEINPQHPHEEIINVALDGYLEGKTHERILSKTIFYDRYTDVTPWITYRAILNRATFSAPEMDYCCSNTFCFEDWLKISGLTRVEQPAKITL